MKVKKFKELLVTMGNLKESAFLTIFDTKKGYFFYTDENGEIRVITVNLTGLFTEELGYYVFDNYTCKQKICICNSNIMLSGSEYMVNIALNCYNYMFKCESNM